MTGRVIIVTGGNSGIGFEVAKYLAEGGNDVVLACRNEEKGTEAVTKIKHLYPNSLVQFMQVHLSLSSRYHCQLCYLVLGLLVVSHCLSHCLSCAFFFIVFYFHFVLCELVRKLV